MRKIIAKRQGYLSQLIGVGSMDALNIAKSVLEKNHESTVGITELLELRKKITENRNDTSLQSLFLEKKKTLLSEL
jgi:ATP-dependent Clp protease ATP-binding subunit ClpA